MKKIVLIIIALISSLFIAHNSYAYNSIDENECKNSVNSSSCDIYDATDDAPDKTFDDWFRRNIIITKGHNNTISFVGPGGTHLTKNTLNFGDANNFLYFDHSRYTYNNANRDKDADLSLDNDTFTFGDGTNTLNFSYYPLSHFYIIYLNKDTFTFGNGDNTLNFHIYFPVQDTATIKLSDSTFTFGSGNNNININSDYNNDPWTINYSGTTAFTSGLGDGKGSTKLDIENAVFKKQDASSQLNFILNSGTNIATLSNVDFDSGVSLNMKGDYNTLTLNGKNSFSGGNVKLANNATVTINGMGSYGNVTTGTPNIDLKDATTATVNLNAQGEDFDYANFMDEGNPIQLNTDGNNTINFNTGDKGTGKKSYKIDLALLVVSNKTNIVNIKGGGTVEGEGPVNFVGQNLNELNIDNTNLTLDDKVTFKGNKSILSVNSMQRSVTITSHDSEYNQINASNAKYAELDVNGNYSLGLIINGLLTPQDVTFNATLKNFNTINIGATHVTIDKYMQTSKPLDLFVAATDTDGNGGLLHLKNGDFGNQKLTAHIYGFGDGIIDHTFKKDLITSDNAMTGLTDGPGGNLTCTDTIFLKCLKPNINDAKTDISADMQVINNFESILHPHNIPPIPPFPLPHNDPRNDGKGHDHRIGPKPHNKKHYHRIGPQYPMPLPHIPPIIPPNDPDHPSNPGDDDDFTSGNNPNINEVARVLDIFLADERKTIIPGATLNNALDVVSANNTEIGKQNVKSFLLTLQPVNNEVLLTTAAINNLKFNTTVLLNTGNRFWANTNYSAGNIENKHYIAGNKLHSTYQAVGVNSNVSDNNIIGITGSYAKTKIKGNVNLYNADLTTINIGLQHSYYFTNNLSITTLGSYGYNGFDLQRNIEAKSNLLDSAFKGVAKSHPALNTLEAGTTIVYNLNSKDGVVASSIYTGVDYSFNTMDNYRETETVPLKVKGFKTGAANANLGLRMATIIPINQDNVITPILSIEGKYTYYKLKDTIASFAEDTANNQFSNFNPKYQTLTLTPMFVLSYGYKALKASLYLSAGLSKDIKTTALGANIRYAL